MEKLKNMYRGVYGWTVQNGKPFPSAHDLPSVVKNRVDYFWDMAEHGMTFMGAMKCIFANQKPEEYDLGATKDWLPMSQEFKDWVGHAYGMAQMEIAVYMIYGDCKEGIND